MKRNFNSLVQLFFAVGFIALIGCAKTDVGMGEDPYAGGKPPLGVIFEGLNRPLPSARPNDVIQLTVRGLNQHKDKLEVFVNEESAKVESLTDSTLDIRLPQQVSSGIVKLKINEQVFFGPNVWIEGKVSLDRDYGIKNGFNGSVSQILSVPPNMWVVGSFHNFENQASSTTFRNGIHIINSNGESVSGDGNKIEKGAEGSISSITRLPDGKYIVGGFMMNYNKHDVVGITRLLSNGALDTARVELINTTPEKPQNAFDTLPAFNANLLGSVVKVFATPDTGVIALGRFSLHSYVDYNYSSRETKTNYFTQVNHIAKIKSNGRLDSTFTFKNTGANGYINDAVQLSDGRIIAVGAFTQFNNTAANRIIAFNPNGTVNTAFAANIGTGANEEIFSVTYNATRNKIALTGRFTSFNGKPKVGVIILNSDGSMDETFTLGDTENKFALYAYVMNNGKVLVSGAFTKYNGINRSQLLILEPNGEARQEYNNLGKFSGLINSVVETTSSLGYPALLIGGTINMADGRTVGNIFRLEVRD